uniref:Uncharacterized protein n=1 Tax=Arundo donax TaxID=35708 RepID=A0A0A9GRI2_ARUDO
MFQHGRYLHRKGEHIDPVQDWLAATVNDDISTVRDWIAARLYGLA